MSLHVTMVQACQRAGRGGSLTAVADETTLSDAERRAVPVRAGASHAAFVSLREDGVVALRFFTATGELPACGHGTVAALAVLARRAGARQYEAVLSSGGRTFLGQASGAGDRYRAAFDPGPVELGDPAWPDSEPVLAALGLDPREVEVRIASVGRARMLVRVRDRRVLAELAPDPARLRQACDRLGLLGCYVYSGPSTDGRAAARMFAPSIGVPEDIANANSTACLAAVLAGQGAAGVEVDMGDTLGQPATVTATSSPGPGGPAIRVGGIATIVGASSGSRSHPGTLTEL
ncbi:PhzF family phenazine biosynthesis protein [Amycolatopsis cynarae]|uniref:PhzF family phenazine biosynthesis protein n=1 Tax=Amycolatopsis cynarae TaxID=2995223 RepID=A0ABY7BBJ2_9PSEU|nr:PhzF family phenazine biosynthesis protein [Amycolatopsis sp. HUAS 11-8]WAL68503.1 PhzF family phenazine biosynthesis protein [Amycolatopsis sp. HUAS 11-8]